MTAFRISLCGSLTSYSTQVFGNRGIIPWAQKHFCLRPSASPRLVAPRRDSVSKLETTVSRFPLRTLGPAANQSWDQPQSISECPRLKAPTEPPGVGARSYSGNPKPPSIIVLAFIIRQAGPTDHRLFPRLRNPTSPSSGTLSSPGTLQAKIYMQPNRRPLSLNHLGHKRNHLTPLQQPTLQVRLCEYIKLPPLSEPHFPI